MSGFYEKLKEHKAVLIFSVLYMACLGVYFASIKNNEFLWYLCVVVFFFALLVLTLRQTNLNNTLLWGLSIWGFLHLLGGGLVVGEDVLYGFVFVRLAEVDGNWILRYDQVVHAYGFAVATLVGYFLLKPQLNAKPSYRIVLFICFLVGMGFGALNELIEFMAVLMVPETNVGGYTNTAIDLVSNMVGALLAILFIRKTSLSFD